MFLRKILSIAPFAYIQVIVFPFIRLILLYLFMEIYHIMYNIHICIEHLLKCTYTENIYINHFSKMKGELLFISHFNGKLGSSENK